MKMDTLIQHETKIILLSQIPCNYIYIFVVFIVGYLLKEEAEKQFSLQCYIILPKNDNVYLLLMLNKC